MFTRILTARQQFFAFVQHECYSPIEMLTRPTTLNSRVLGLNKEAIKSWSAVLNMADERQKAKRNLRAIVKIQRGHKITWWCHGCPLNEKSISTSSFYASSGSDNETKPIWLILYLQVLSSVVQSVKEVLSDRPFHLKINASLGFIF